MKFGPSDIGALDARWGDARGARVHHVERSHVCAFTALWGEFTVCIYCTVVCVVRLHSTLALDDARRGDARGACVHHVERSHAQGHLAHEQTCCTFTVLWCAFCNCIQPSLSTTRGGATPVGRAYATRLRSAPPSLPTTVCAAAASLSLCPPPPTIPTAPRSPYHARHRISEKSDLMYIRTLRRWVDARRGDARGARVRYPCPPSQRPRRRPLRKCGVWGLGFGVQGSGFRFRV